MSFWILPAIFIVFGAILAIAWYFNTEFFSNFYKIFWFQLFIGSMGNAWLVPCLLWEHFYPQDPKNVEVLQLWYLIFVAGLSIITLVQFLNYYRKTYILVEEKNDET